MSVALVRGALLSVVLLLSGSVQAFGAVPSLRGIAVEETLDNPSAVLEALSASAAAPGLAVVVRLVIDPAVFRGPGATTALERLDARLAQYRGRDIPVVLVLGRFPDAEADEVAWLRWLGTLAERARAKVAGFQIGDLANAPLPDVARYAFLLQRAAVQIQSVDGDALVVVGSIPANEAAWLGRAYALNMAPYVDAVAVASPAGADNDAFRALVAALGAVVTREDPTAAVWLGPLDLSSDPTQAAAQLVSAELRALGTKVGVTAFRVGGPPLRAALTAAARVADVLSGAVVSLDASAVRLFRGGVDVTAQIPHQLLFSLGRSTTYLVYGGDTGTTPIDAEVSVSMTEPAVRDPLTGATDRLSAPARQGNGPVRLRLRVTDHPLVLDFNFGLAAYSSVAEARHATLPPVEEIIARHQQVQTAQDAAVRNYIAHSRIVLNFHLSAADPAHHVVMENRVFFDMSGLEWAQLSFSMDGATWTTNPPAFPLLQPEKVLSLPLDLRLNQDYRYKLEGVDTLDGHEAFVVRFDPVDQSKALYRGTLWIDRSSFVRLKISAVETHLTGTVASNEEEQVFTSVGDVNGRAVWLPSRQTFRQTVLFAGHTVLLEREVDLSDIRVNATDFEGARAEARASDHLMFRETDLGLRNFVKKGTTRVTSDQLTRSARAFAMGADFNPSLDYPLPIAGLDILDFNFLHRDLQLALLFGGVIGFGNIQRAGLWGGRFDVSVDFFGLALRVKDKAFGSEGERPAERVRTTPVSVGGDLGFRINSSHKVAGRYEVRYDGYFRDPTTPLTFETPSSTATTGEGGSYEYRHRGYSLAASATAFQRSTWKPWGEVSAFDSSSRTYTRYDAGVSKDFVFATFHTIHLNGQYFGGQRLDRFSMYQFGMFDPTRMHGVPSAVRFGELAMFRGSYSFNLFEQYRLDLFVDHAIGRDRRVDDQWKDVTGLGASVSLRGPRSTILKIDIGKSVLPTQYRGAGSTVVQFLLLKPL